MIRKLVLSFSLFSACFLGTIGVVYADNEATTIAGLVNDEVITFSEYKARLNILYFESGLPKNAANDELLKSEALRALVDEKVQIQEAETQKVKVNDDEIEKGVASIAQQVQLSPDKFSELLRNHNIPQNAFRQQVKATIAWQKLVQQAASADISVAEEEINEKLDFIKANAGKPEYLVAVIDLPVLKAEQESDTLHLAEKLRAQINAGSQFTTIARQFSQSASAQSGGDMGWIVKGQLSPELDTALASLMPGQVSKPVRSAFGYHLVLLRGKRKVLEGDMSKAKAHIKQLHLSYPEESTELDREMVNKEADRIIQTVKGCKSFEQEMQKHPSAVTGDLGTVALSAVPGEIFMLLSSIDVGQPSPMMKNETGVLILMVCDKEEPKGELPSAQIIENQLFYDKVDVFQKRYLRDLRDTAYIEIRI